VAAQQVPLLENDSDQDILLAPLHSFLDP
jgi:hypothetical protein